MWCVLFRILIVFLMCLKFRCLCSCRIVDIVLLSIFVLKLVVVLLRCIWLWFIGIVLVSLVVSFSLKFDSFW